MGLTVARYSLENITPSRPWGTRVPPWVCVHGSQAKSNSCLPRVHKTHVGSQCPGPTEALKTLVQRRDASNSVFFESLKMVFKKKKKKKKRKDTPGSRWQCEPRVSQPVAKGVHWDEDGLIPLSSAPNSSGWKNRKLEWVKWTSETSDVKKKCYVHLISCAGVSSENHKWRVSLLLSYQGERTGHGPVWVWRHVYLPSVPVEAEGEKGEWGPGSWLPQHSLCSPFSIIATEQCLTDINSKHSAGIFRSPVLMHPPGSWLSFWPPSASFQHCGEPRIITPIKE